MLARILARAALTLAVLSPCAAAGGDAQPSPSPSPAPTAAPGSIRLRGMLFAYGLDQRYTGPGVVPVEAAAFASGSPLSPGTPYDFFTSAPITPGLGFSSGAIAEATFGGRHVDLRLQLGAQTLAGSATGNAYWGEPPIPTLDPHLSANRFPSPIVFPAAAGRDDATLTRFSVLAGELATKDRGVRLRGGWLDLVQSDGFVFAPIPRPNATPALATTLAETQGGGPPALDAWTARSPSLPLAGIDLFAVRGPWSFEATDAALPQPPGTDARMLTASVVYQRGGLRLSAQGLRAWSGGATVTSTAFFGTDQTVYPATQGPLISSLLEGQRQTILGVRAAIPFAGGEAVGEYGRSTYGTTAASRPGTSRPGTWTHVQYERKTGAIDWTGDYFRFEPRYATMFLPYGTPENVWSVAYSWPGPWLKGTYQLIDTTAVGINREGGRLRASMTGGRLEAKAVFAQYRQIEPIDLAHATLEGWVEGFYLPQFGSAATLGRQRQYGAWLAYHPALADLTLEVLEDTQHRDAASPFGLDAVSLRFPGWTLNVSRRSGATLLWAGLGRYGLFGNFSSAGINADLAQRVASVGAQFRESDAMQAQVTWRWYAVQGIPVTSGAALPQMHGAQLFVEQRLTFGAP